MDVDLSTDLSALLPLVAPLLSGHSDVAIGSRLSRTVARRPRPEARADLALLQPAAAHDAAAPASPTRSAASRRCAPSARARCCRTSATTPGSSTPSCSCSPSAAGLRIAEVPVDWVDDPDSRVDIVATARRRPARRRARRPRPRHAATLPLRELRQQFGRGELDVPGVPKRLAWQAIRFALDRRPEHARLPALFLCCARRLGAQAANLVALLLTAVAQHRRQPPIHVRRPAARRAARHQAQGLVVFAPRPGAHQRRRSPCSPLRPPTRRGASRSPCSSRRTSPRPRCASSCCATGSSPAGRLDNAAVQECR